jgi:FtsP/CotA-like multicopper oxidase with cupredoxin domain
MTTGRPERNEPRRGGEAVEEVDAGAPARGTPPPAPPPSPGRRDGRRTALRWGLGAATALAFCAYGATVAASFGVFDRLAKVRRFELPFRTPPVLAPVSTDATTDYYEVTQMKNRVELLPGLRTEVWGYNGLFPGPTIRARSGRRAVVRQTNALPEPVSVHLHGGVQRPESDGYPTDAIPPGGTKEYDYANARRGATLFYHDHAMDLTGPHVYMGLSGMYVLEDEVEGRLPLPTGDFDVPLIIQDRSFRPDGSFAFRPHDPSNVFAEFGTTILVNGVPWPRFPVAARRYRFRILNASASSSYGLALSNGQPLIQIATDGGLLDRPVPLSALTLASAERADVVVDFGALPPGTTVDLLNTLGGGDQDRIMRFEVTRPASDDSQVPDTLAPLERLSEAQAEGTRDFVFAPTPQPRFPPFRWTINGRLFDPAEVAARVPLERVEIWRFDNRTLGLGPAARQEHPVHVHLVNFLVLDRDGKPPQAYERGWKDTVLVGIDETVRVIARFGPFRGKYVLHCHNLAHEDHAMMANFVVV